MSVIKIRIVTRGQWPAKISPRESISCIQVEINGA